MRNFVTSQKGNVDLTLNKKASCRGLLMNGILISLSFWYLIADKLEFRGSIFLVKVIQKPSGKWGTAVPIILSKEKINFLIS